VAARSTGALCAVALVSAAQKRDRVPCLVVSPWARRDYIGTRTYDHTSILRMIEQRWSLPPLTVRDGTATA